MGVGLGQAEHGNVQAAAIVEVKLVGLVNHCMGVGRRAKAHAAGRYATDDAGLSRQGDEIDDFFFCGYAGNPFGHTNTQVDHTVRPQLQRRSAGNDFAFAQRHGGQRILGHPYLARVRGVVVF